MRKRSEDFDLDAESGAEPDPAAGMGPAHAHPPGAVRSDRWYSDSGHSGLRPARALSIRGPLPWAIAAVVLVVVGVVISERPPSPWQVGMVTEIGAPSEQWFVPVTAEEGTPPDVWVQPGAVVMARSTEVLGFDDDTGDELWRVEGQSLRCEQHAPGEHVLCASGIGEEAELVHLDPRSGEVERTPAPGLVAASPHGEGMLHLHENDGDVTLQRRGADGSTYWDVDLGFLDVELPTSTGPGSGPPEGSDMRVTLGSAGDYVLVSVEVTRWGDDPTTGWIHAVHHAEDGSVVPDLADAWVGRLPGDPAPWFLVGPEDAGAWFLDADGNVSDPVGMGALWAMVDDDPTSDIALATDDEDLIARSVDGETTYWTTTLGHSPLMIGRVDGQVLVHEGARTMALHERTGSEVWSQLGLNPSRALTDGSTLLTFSTDTSRIVLTGVDVRTGQVEFEVPGAASESATVLGIHPRGEQLAVVTNSGLSMWSLT